MLALSRLEEAGLTRRVVTTVVELARSDSTPVKEAVCRAAGHLALAEGKGDLPPNSAIASLVPLFVALMGADQASDVQRQQLHVSKSICCRSRCQVKNILRSCWGPHIELHYNDGQS